jgi:hypothetical protein
MPNCCNRRLHQLPSCGGASRANASTFRAGGFPHGTDNPCCSSSSRLGSISCESHGGSGTRKDEDSTIATYRARCQARKLGERCGYWLLICSLILSSASRESAARIARGCRSSSIFFTIAITARNISKITMTDTVSSCSEIQPDGAVNKSAACAGTAQWPVRAKCLDSDN